MSVMLTKRREAEERFCVMALKAILDNLDGVAADVAKEYKHRDDGKYVLDVTPVDGVELAEVSKLQSALSKERENSRKSTELLKAFDGIDANKARDAMNKVAEMTNWTPEQKVKEQIEAIRTQLLDAHGKEKSKLEEKLGKLNKALEEAMIVSVATQALAEQKGSVKLLMPHVRQQTRLRDADGKLVVEVLAADGTPRTAGSDGHAMTITELVTEMKTQDDFASAFEGSGATGTGATPGPTRGGNRNNAAQLKELAELPPAERMKRAQELGIKK